jgi:hypothetical protein
VRLESEHDGEETEDMIDGLTTSLTQTVSGRLP